MTATASLARLRDDSDVRDDLPLREDCTLPTLRRSVWLATEQIAIGLQLLRLCDASPEDREALADARTALRDLQTALRDYGTIAPPEAADDSE